VATLGKNDIIGEIAVRCDGPRTATVVAHGNLEILRLSKNGFFHLVTQFPQVGIEVMSALAAKLHRTTQALTAARPGSMSWEGQGRPEPHRTTAPARHR
jgi:CRP/FNR family cyclic AMP-dependent transcriptional regulator